MKKILLISLTFSLAHISFAQKTTPGGIYFPDVSGENNNAMVIPKEYAYNNKPLLTFTERTNPSHIMVYDENIELIKSFDIDNDKVFSYTLTYQKESREVNSATEEILAKYDLNQSFAEWLAQEKLYDSSLEQALVITKKENGDSIISVDYSKAKNSYSSNEQMYFGYSYFGMKYPKTYWLASKGTMSECRASYSVEYSEWEPTGETIQESYSERLRHIPLYNLNIDNGGGTNVTNGTYFEISQTLFNQDEDFEYIIPKLDLVAPGNSIKEIKLCVRSQIKMISLTHIRNYCYLCYQQKSTYIWQRRNRNIRNCRCSTTRPFGNRQPPRFPNRPNRWKEMQKMQRNT